MKLFDGIIFDVDGTLTSTNELIYASFRHVTNKYLNKNYTDEEIYSMFGPTEDGILKEICGDDFEGARKDYYDFYTENHHMADLYPGIIDILKMLKQRDIKLSVYTGKGSTAAAITLKKLGIYDYFDMIVTGDDVKEHKPSPEGVQVFVDRFSLDKERVLIVGDAVADIKAARNSGIKSASVVWDSYAKEKVLAMESDYVFNTVEELKKFLGQNT
jgi:HAD superfamily hydrolase (TIGR01549 family)